MELPKFPFRDIRKVPHKIFFKGMLVVQCVGFIKFFSKVCKSKHKVSFEEKRMMVKNMSLESD